MPHGHDGDCAAEPIQQRCFVHSRAHRAPSPARRPCAANSIALQRAPQPRGAAMPGLAPARMRPLPLRSSSTAGARALAAGSGRPGRFSPGGWGPPCMHTLFQEKQQRPALAYIAIFNWEDYKTAPMHTRMDPPQRLPARNAATAALIAGQLPGCTGGLQQAASTA